MQKSSAAFEVASWMSLLSSAVLSTPTYLHESCFILCVVNFVKGQGQEPGQR